MITLNGLTVYNLPNYGGPVNHISVITDSSEIGTGAFIIRKNTLGDMKAGDTVDLVMKSKVDDTSHTIKVVVVSIESLDKTSNSAYSYMLVTVEEEKTKLADKILNNNYNMIEYGSIGTSDDTPNYWYNSAGTRVSSAESWNTVIDDILDGTGITRSGDVFPSEEPYNLEVAGLTALQALALICRFLGLRMRVNSGTATFYTPPNFSLGAQSYLSMKYTPTLTDPEIDVQFMNVEYRSEGVSNIATTTAPYSQNAMLYPWRPIIGSENAEHSSLRSALVSNYQYANCNYELLQLLEGDLFPLDSDRYTFFLWKNAAPAVMLYRDVAAIFSQRERPEQDLGVFSFTPLADGTGTVACSIDDLPSGNELHSSYDLTDPTGSIQFEAGTIGWGVRVGKTFIPVGGTGSNENSFFPNDYLVFLDAELTVDDATATVSTSTDPSNIQEDLSIQPYKKTAGFSLPTTVYNQLGLEGTVDGQVRIRRTNDSEVPDWVIVDTVKKRPRFLMGPISQKAAVISEESFPWEMTPELEIEGEIPSAEAGNPVEFEIFQDIADIFPDDTADDDFNLELGDHVILRYRPEDQKYYLVGTASALIGPAHEYETMDELVLDGDDYVMKKRNYQIVGRRDAFPSETVVFQQFEVDLLDDATLGGALTFGVNTVHVLSTTADTPIDIPLNTDGC